jgi:hypothetical protein
VTRQEFERDVLIVVCAISAGIHGALVREHFSEGRGAGIGFLAATVVLSFLVVALTRGGANTTVLGAAAAVLVGLIASYVLAITTGLPLMHPDPEPVEGLALATKGIEAVGLFAALHLSWHGRPAVALTLPRREGTLT